MKRSGETDPTMEQGALALGPSTSPRSRPDRDQAGGVTGRAVVVAFFLLVAVAFLNFFIEMDWGINWSGSWSFSSGAPALVPVAVLFALTAAMHLPLVRRVALTRRELLAVYAIVLVGAPVLTHAVLGWMLVKNVGYYYSAQVNPYWQTTFLKHIPSWWAPSDLGAVNGFFDGESTVPWSLWQVPLLAWGSFMVALFVCSVCFIALLQRQWISNERLTFPVAQVPLEMVRGGADAGARGGLPVAAVFWIGLGASFALNFLSSLSDKIPALPKVPLTVWEIIPWHPVGPLAGIGGISLVLWPWMLALAYLIPKDLSFSVWFFSLLRIGLTVAAIAAGAPPMRPEDWWSSSFPAPYFQGGGAVLALLMWMLWIARPHLRRVVSIALGREGAHADTDEPLAYRTAFIGLIASFAFMVWFLWLSNCRVIFGVVLIAMTISYFAIWARIRAETGLGFLCFPIQIQQVAVVPFGSRVFRISELVTLITMRWAYTPGFSASFEVFPGAVLESFKIADSARINPRRLTAGLTAGFLLSLVVGIAIFMTGVYRLGWFGLSCTHGGWLGPQSIGDGGAIASLVTDATYEKTDINGLIALFGGGVVAVTLGAMRLRFWWWPFHPVGYLASNTWGSHWWCIPFFIGWMCKALVTRYGGLRLYRKSVPLAIGFIVGDLLNGGVWAMVRVATLGRL